MLKIYDQSPPLVDIFTTTESILEQKLCACLICLPIDVLSIAEDFKPEVNNAAKYFWGQVQDRKILMSKSPPNEQFEICFNLIFKRDPKTLFRWLDLLGGENSFLAIQTIIADIKALRMVRKSVDYLQKNKTITKVFDERYNRWG